MAEPSSPAPHDAAADDATEEAMRRALEIHARLMREHSFDFLAVRRPEPETPPPPPPSRPDGGTGT